MALRRTRQRTGTASRLVVVGLANPGSSYEGSRHNVGGDAVRLVAQRHGATLSLEKRQRCQMATVTTPLGPVTLAVPTTYMNESGAALPPLLERTSLEDLHHLIVVHDELDLEPGRRQVKFGGGLAGHNGLRSIAGVLGTQDFTRLRIGIGKAPHKDRGADWVLTPPRGEARESLRADVEAAADAIELLMELTAEQAQARINAS